MSGCLIKNQEFILKCFEVGKYSADRFGNILSHIGPNNQIRIKPYKLSQTPDPFGYIRHIFVLQDERKSIFSHVVIWLWFNRIKYSSSMHVNHIDGNKTNNKIENLELLDYGQNAAHASSKNLYRTGIRHHKWSNCRVDSHSICFDRLQGRSVRALALYYQTSPSTISRICRAGGIKDVRRFREKIRNEKGRFT